MRDSSIGHVLLFFLENGEVITQTFTLHHKIKKCMVGSPGLVVMGIDSRSKVVGSNPGTIYWMDIFSHKFVVKIVMFV